MRNTHGLDVMATSIEVRLSVPRTGISGLDLKIIGVSGLC